jgi:ABC-type proline/glycine betaine transport system permease subunit
VFHNHTAHVAELNGRLLDGHGETYILRAFGIARGWGLLLRHCILCFLSGCVCAFIHIGINLWLSETNLVAGIVMPVLAFGVVPPLVIFLFMMDTPACHECFEERCGAVTSFFEIVDSFALQAL